MGSPAPGAFHRRILVVDDEPALRYLVARAFRERGYDVAEAADGLAALEVVRSTPEPFHLVITNSQMPHIDGPRLAECLRELDPSLPIIHLSGSHGSSKKNMPPDVPTLFKPFRMSDLMIEAEELMEERESG
jgi:two-component system, cell cycle sensor histidine kinase and response regulator CckA